MTAISQYYDYGQNNLYLILIEINETFYSIQTLQPFIPYLYLEASPAIIFLNYCIFSFKNCDGNHVIV